MEKYTSNSSQEEFYLPRVTPFALEEGWQSTVANIIIENFRPPASKHEVEKKFDPSVHDYVNFVQAKIEKLKDSIVSDKGQTHPPEIKLLCYSDKIVLEYNTNRQIKKRDGVYSIPLVQRLAIDKEEVKEYKTQSLIQKLRLRQQQNSTNPETRLQ